MFDFVGRLFGSSKAGEKVIDGAISAIDKVWYTEEEKAEDAAQARREAMAVYMEWIKGTSGSRVARRLIALFALFIWGIQQIGATGFKISAVWADNPELIERMIESSKLLQDQADSSNGLVAVVFAFYFGGPAAVDIAKQALGRFAEKKDQ